MTMGQMSRQISLKIGTSEVLWPYEVVNLIQARMEHGLAKHPDGDGWDLDVVDLVTLAEDHLANYWADDTDDDHLLAALTRLMMAVAVERGLNK